MKLSKAQRAALLRLIDRGQAVPTRGVRTFRVLVRLGLAEVEPTDKAWVFTTYVPTLAAHTVAAIVR